MVTGSTPVRRTKLGIWCNGSTADFDSVSRGSSPCIPATLLGVDMKIYIGPYKDYISPYAIVDKIFFWQNRYRGDDILDRWDYKLNNKISKFLSGKNDDSWLSKLCQWIHEKRERTVKIHIHQYDTWNMDTTLALIIVPMLKQLKATTHGSPMLHQHEQTSNGSSQYCFPFYAEGDQEAWDQGHKQWEEMLDKMIWSFEQVNINWEEQFQSGKTDFYFEKIEGTDQPGWAAKLGHTNYSEMKHGPLHTYKYDHEGAAKHMKRMQEGFDLFGKYYRNLWD